MQLKKLIATVAAAMLSTAAVADKLSRLCLRRSFLTVAGHDQRRPFGGQHTVTRLKPPLLKRI